MEHKTQDPAVIILDGRLADAETREIFPDDEPVIVLRASNPKAMAVLNFYLSVCQLLDCGKINQRCIDFMQYKHFHRG